MIHSHTETVTFTAPFTLPGLGRFYPAGPYAVTTDDEQLDLSFSAFRRVATVILLRSGAETQAWLVSPADLADALVKDATNPRP